MTDVAVAAGFDAPVLGAQTAFRAVMDTMARPGTIRPLDGLADAPAPLFPATAALVLTLLDYETPFWLDAPFTDAPEVARWIAFHTGATITTDPGEAAFAFIADPAAAPPFDSFALGTPEFPDRSTTLIVQVSTLGAGTPLTLRGPGIAGARRFAAAPLPPDFAALLAANRTLFPRGVDLVLAAEHAIAALPRSVCVEPGD
jgi:alpha-D-ribose 1-methylphosphonate 5-triphosphate synthase subunit PhnH